MSKISTSISIMLVAYLTGSCCATATYDLPLNGSSIVSMLERQPKLNVVSFKPLGEDIALGLDFLLPFLKVPIMREVDVYGNEPALININTAALVSTGILAASSAFVSYIFRSYIVFEPTEKSEKRHRSDNNYETELWSMVNNFKVIYKNSTGTKVDTSLTELLTTIDESFQQKDIDLSSCLQKALCQRLQQSSTSRPYGDGNASGLEKIIDGVTSLKWVRRNLLRYTSLHDVIDNNDERMFSSRHQNHIACEAKYPRCQWSVPAENIGSMIGAYLKFT